MNVRSTGYYFFAVKCLVLAWLRCGRFPTVYSCSSFSFPLARGVSSLCELDHRFSISTPGGTRPDSSSQIARSKRCDKKNESCVKKAFLACNCQDFIATQTRSSTGDSRSCDHNVHTSLNVFVQKVGGGNTLSLSSPPGSTQYLRKPPVSAPTPPFFLALRSRWMAHLRRSEVILKDFWHSSTFGIRGNVVFVLGVVAAVVRFGFGLVQRT